MNYSEPNIEPDTVEVALDEIVLAKYHPLMGSYTFIHYLPLSKALVSTPNPYLAQSFISSDYAYQWLEEKLLEESNKVRREYDAYYTYNITGTVNITKAM